MAIDRHLHVIAAIVVLLLQLLLLQRELVISSNGLYQLLYSLPIPCQDTHYVASFRLRFRFRLYSPLYLHRLLHVLLLLSMVPLLAHHRVVHADLQ